MTNIRDLFSLAGQCAVVIGGTGKIGAPMAEALAEAGARVYIAARKVETGHPVIAGLAKQELDVHGICLDQSDEASVASAIETITSQYKPPNIVVNSGVSWLMPQFNDDSVEAWDRSMAVNARGIFVTCRAFAKSMAANNGGSIINVSSIYGLIAPDPKNYEGSEIGTAPDYPYNKGGMIMLSKYFATYYARSCVRVNCIAPGGLFNNQPEPFYSRYVAKVPLGRMAVPDDLKGVTVFLASSASSYVTGTVIPVDGGLTVQ